MIIINILQKLNIFNRVYRLFNKKKKFRKILDYLFLKGKDRSKKKVSVKLMGGLGNQLFQITTVLAYSWKYSLIPIFEKIKESPSRVRGRPTYWDTIFQNLSVSKHLPYRLVIFREKDATYHKIPRPDLIENFVFSNGILLDGFFQSAKYFHEFRERLLSCIFIIKSSEKEFLKKKYPEIFNEEKITVSVHIRRDDNVSHPWPEFFPNLWDTDYYEKSIAYFLDKFSSENLRFVVISDDPSWSKEFMKKKFIMLKPIFPHEKDYLDLYLMSSCKHNIISNSSFSWWASYLNKNPEKIITAPKVWFGLVGPSNWDDIYMDDWIIIDNESNKL